MPTKPLPTFTAEDVEDGTGAMIKFKVEKAINSRPFRVSWARESTRDIEAAYLDALHSRPSTAEIARRLADHFEIAEDLARGLHYTLATQFFLRNRMIDNTFLDRQVRPIVYWVNPSGMEYLQSLREKISR